MLFPIPTYPSRSDCKRVTNKMKAFKESEKASYNQTGPCEFDNIYLSLNESIFQLKVSSSTVASGALLFTEAIPFSMAAILSYISLVPIICPLLAFKLK